MQVIGRALSPGARATRSLGQLARAVLPHECDRPTLAEPAHAWWNAGPALRYRNHRRSRIRYSVRARARTERTKLWPPRCDAGCRKRSHAAHLLRYGMAMVSSIRQRRLGGAALDLGFPAGHGSVGGPRPGAQGWVPGGGSTGGPLR